MHKKPLRCPSPQPPPPCVQAPIWLQLPLPQRHQCPELITPLLISVMPGEPREENKHERQD
jgi:hypothetical protein